MALGTLLSIGGSLLGGMLDGDGGVGDANAANAALNRQIQNMFREMGQQEALRFREATGLFQSRADNVLGDLDRAEAQIGAAGRTAQRGASERNQKNSANLQQNLINSGFKNSTIGANLQRGVNQDFEKNLNQITSQTNAIKSNLGTRRAGVRAQVEGDIANLPLLQNASTQDRLRGFAGALEKMGHTPSGESGGFGSLFGSLGGALGESGSFGNLFGQLGGLFG